MGQLNIHYRENTLGFPPVLEGALCRYSELEMALVNIQKPAEIEEMEEKQAINRHVNEENVS